ncbi:hypothetical protein C8R48DRAFT_32421 [Suillus tomentosus]|nr:hypothetical protein C8R48DRAFT_32421 [Suillus tomentosus]
MGLVAERVEAHLHLRRSQQSAIGRCNSYPATKFGVKVVSEHLALFYDGATYLQVHVWIAFYDFVNASEREWRIPVACVSFSAGRSTHCR